MIQHSLFLMHVLICVMPRRCRALPIVMPLVLQRRGFDPSLLGGVGYYCWCHCPHLQMLLRYRRRRRRAYCFFFYHCLTYDLLHYNNLNTVSTGCSASLHQSHMMVSMRIRSMLHDKCIWKKNPESLSLIIANSHLQSPSIFKDFRFWIQVAVAGCGQPSAFPSLLSTCINALGVLISRHKSERWQGRPGF